MLVNVLALSDIDNGAENPSPPFGADGIQPDLHGELRTVFPKPVEISASAHCPRTWVTHEIRPIRRMLVSIFAGYQDIHRLSEQFLACVSEKHLGLRIDQDDFALVVRHNH